MEIANLISALTVSLTQFGDTNIALSIYFFILNTDLSISIDFPPANYACSTYITTAFVEMRPLFVRGHVIVDAESYNFE